MVGTMAKIDMYIKELGLTDINELQKVSVETFHDTFAAQNTEKKMWTNVKYINFRYNRL